MITLEVSAEVNGEKCTFRTSMDERTFLDPLMKEIIEENLRRSLVDEILKKYKPAIRVL